LKARWVDEIDGIGQYITMEGAGSGEWRAGAHASRANGHHASRRPSSGRWAPVPAPPRAPRVPVEAPGRKGVGGPRYARVSRRTWSSVVTPARPSIRYRRNVTRPGNRWATLCSRACPGGSLATPERDYSPDLRIRGTNPADVRAQREPTASKVVRDLELKGRRILGSCCHQSIALSEDGSVSFPSEQRPLNKHTWAAGRRSLWQLADSPTSRDYLGVLPVWYPARPR
jgi:hypothetical protein